MGTPPITPAPPLDNAPRPGWWSRNWKWFVPTGCLAIVALFAAFIAAIVMVVVGSMKSSDAYKMAMAQVEKNPRVVERLGKPIDAGMFIGGSINVEGTSGKADLTIPISGPKGKGTIYLDATKFAGEWKFNRLEVGFEGDPDRIDLLEPSPPPEPHDQ